MPTWTVGSNVTIDGRTLCIVAAHIAAGPVDSWCLDAPDGTRYRYVVGLPLFVVGACSRD